MNPLKKGPEIKFPSKLPALKVPKFLSDLYADLRDRHLLPFVAVLAIAIVAVPIALSESSTEEEAATPIAPVGRASSSAGGGNDVVVARSVPGLRNYHQRLGHLSPSNPFKPKFTNSKPKSESSSSGEESSASSSSESSEGEVTVTTEGGETSTTTHHLFYFTWEIDVRVVPVSSNGHPSEAEPSVRRGLPELTPLPGRKTPALTFMQPSADEKGALMLVNSNVQGLFGEAVCVSGGDTCQLLELKKGLPETVVYGANERIFRIELLDVKVVETDPPKATPGKPQKDQAG